MMRSFSSLRAEGEAIQKAMSTKLDCFVAKTPRNDGAGCDAS
jgi:hypothetical protein